MGYHINKYEFDKELISVLAEMNCFSIGVEGLKASLHNITSSSIISGAGAESLREYIETAHIQVLTLIKKIVRGFTITAAGFSRNFLPYEENPRAIFDEDYFTSVVEQLEAFSEYMKTYQAEARELERSLPVSELSYDPVFLVKSDDDNSYYDILETEKKNVTQLRDEIKKYDANYKQNYEEVSSWIRAAQSRLDYIRATIKQIETDPKSAAASVKAQKGTIDSIITKADQYISDNKENDEYNTRFLQEVKLIHDMDEREKRCLDNLYKIVKHLPGIVLSVVGMCGAASAFVSATTFWGKFIAINSFAGSTIDAADKIEEFKTGETDVASNLVIKTCFEGNSKLYYFYRLGFGIADWGVDTKTISNFTDNNIEYLKVVSPFSDAKDVFENNTKYNESLDKSGAIESVESIEYVASTEPRVYKEYNDYINTIKNRSESIEYSGGRKRYINEVESVLGSKDKKNNIGSGNN